MLVVGQIERQLARAVAGQAHDNGDMAGIMGTSQESEAHPYVKRNGEAILGIPVNGGSFGSRVYGLNRKGVADRPPRHLRDHPKGSPLWRGWCGWCEGQGFPTWAAR